ncbi:hypothetical protein Anapl_09392 [Anas platyrhynchos]|uniref:Uncharacterized protein n=1 Tax=Anas platyrhynchos TaxID=8839 RepID=R0JYC9_ANAPL|nr:hypothetical protein Anapl_09392 [Anas platyrhynchos]
MMCAPLGQLREAASSQPAAGRSPLSPVPPALRSPQYPFGVCATPAGSEAPSERVSGSLTPVKGGCGSSAAQGCVAALSTSALRAFVPRPEKIPSKGFGTGACSSGPPEDGSLIAQVVTLLVLKENARGLKNESPYLEKSDCLQLCEETRKEVGDVNVRKAFSFVVQTRLWSSSSEQYFGISIKIPRCQSSEL